MSSPDRPNYIEKTDEQWLSLIITEASEQGKVIKRFSIQRTIEDIPNAEDCPLCGSSTEKAIVPYLIRGDLSLIVNETSPGYKCSDCGAGLLDLQTTLELVKGVLPFLGDDEDPRLRSAFMRNVVDLRSEIETREQSPSKD